MCIVRTNLNLAPSACACCNHMSSSHHNERLTFDERVFSVNNNTIFRCCFSILTLLVLINLHAPIYVDLPVCRFPAFWYTGMRELGSSTQKALDMVLSCSLLSAVNLPSFSVAKLLQSYFPLKCLPLLRMVVILSIGSLNRAQKI